MLFMGEEWAASTPFPYFSSHPEPNLAGAVTEGRVREFAKLGWDPDEVADPQDPETFHGAVLRWDEIEVGRHAVVLNGYRELARLRHSLAELTNPDLRRVRSTVDEDARWITVERGDVLLAANLGDFPSTISLAIDTYEVVWQTPTPVTLDGDRLTLPRHAGAVLLRR
jgi:maltooligosyltrehalose trehalohydrolase